MTDRSSCFGSDPFIASSGQSQLSKMWYPIMRLKHLPMHFVAIAMAICVCSMVGCDNDSPAKSATAKVAPKLSNQIVAVSYPLQYLTQRIAGDSIEVSLPFPPDTQDPQHWRPSREAIGQMQSADLIIANGTGATYAQWLTTVSLADSKIRNTASRGLLLSDYIAVEDITVVHSHGPEGEHSHPTMVARTWLDPAIAKKQATYIARELTSVYPDRADQFATHLKSLSEDLDQLSEQIKALKNDAKHVVVTATPNLKFLTRIADVGNHHLTWFETPSLDQANSDLKKMLEASDSKPTVILFDDNLPPDDIMAVLKENGLMPLAIDLIDRKPASGDYLSQLRLNIETLAAALKK